VRAVVIIVKVVSCDRGKVVGLGGVTHTVEVVQDNSAREERAKVGV
jgi:hypothetical protein